MDEQNQDQNIDHNLEEKNRKKKRKLRKLIWMFMLTGITSVILIVGTYAWFIGLSTVEVSSFEIEVSTEKGLFLSLDGEHWVEDLTITEAGVLRSTEPTTTELQTGGFAYANNKNHWAGEKGLTPVSTDGTIDTTNSVLKLYSKSSMTATPGGYRLTANQVDNAGTNAPDEQDGYVVFDLFVKNGNGDSYNKIYNVLDDEAVYLTKNSGVVAVPSGDDDYGLANSVRVAFVQIGRVAINESIENITGISCTTNTNVTGLCVDVKPTIWEPNDSKHNANLISYFNRVCKKRDASTTEYLTGENVGCTPATNGTAALGATTPVTTYVVNRNISSAEKVDIYDGINGLTITDSSPLTASETFTDTMKNAEVSVRPEFMLLAANSITKVRVYVYLEGQDVDNYDLATNGKKVKVNFGFTKDKLDQLSEEESS